MHNSLKLLIFSHESARTKKYYQTHLSINHLPAYQALEINAYVVPCERNTTKKVYLTWLGKSRISPGKNVSLALNI